jgi:hypothetical protein
VPAQNQRISGRTSNAHCAHLCRYETLASYGALRDDPRMPNVSDRVINIGAVAFIAGLVSWYAGASDAIDRMLSAWTTLLVACGLGVVAAMGALIVQRSVRKRDVGNAVFLAVGIAFISFNCAALLNRYADTSSVRRESGTVLSFAMPNKGPRSIRIALTAQRISLIASKAPGCDIGNNATVELRTGALGTAWVQNVTCGATTTQ